jgi:hypothetical protein
MSGIFLVVIPAMVITMMLPYRTRRGNENDGEIQRHYGESYAESLHVSRHGLVLQFLKGLFVVVLSGHDSGARELL